jgi:hypothetical protein
MKTEFYLGHAITYKTGLYWALGKPFKTKAAAKKAIDNICEKEAPVCITKGVWRLDERENPSKSTIPFAIVALRGNACQPIADICAFPPNNEVHLVWMKANGQLIVDAGNVANETGLLPRQLLARKNDLEGALKEMCRCYDPNNSILFSDMRKALNNATTVLSVEKNQTTATGKPEDFTRLYTALYRDGEDNYQTNLGNRFSYVEDWCLNKKPKWMTVCDQETGEVVATYKNGVFTFHNS